MQNGTKVGGVTHPGDWNGHFLIEISWIQLGWPGCMDPILYKQLVISCIEKCIVKTFGAECLFVLLSDHPHQSYVTASQSKISLFYLKICHI